MYDIKPTLSDDNLQASESSVQRWEINDEIPLAISWATFSITRSQQAALAAFQVYI